MREEVQVEVEEGTDWNLKYFSISRQSTVDSRHHVQGTASGEARDMDSASLFLTQAKQIHDDLH